MALKVNAEEYALKWGTNLKRSGTFISAGVDKVTQAPGLKAAQQSALMLAKITDSVTSGMWGRRVASVSLDSWKRSMKDKGIGRINQGVDSAMDKQKAMAVNLLKAVEESVAVVNQTPRGDLETNITRMISFVREMNQRRGSIRT